MKNKPKFTPKSLIAQASIIAKRVKPYALLIFLLFVASLYGFVLFRINSLNNAQPSADAVSSQVKAAKLPHIDQATISQLQSLQDHSVSVQALFSQARNNPFQ